MLSAHKATYIFTQDERRALFLSSTLKQRKEKFKIVFNSPKGKPDKTKSNYFRKLFNISDEKLIVLCIGSMTDEHYVIDLVNSIENWDEKFVLILHGWFPDEKVKLYVQDKMMEYHDKLFLSDKFFPENQKHLPYQACDIGFVGFKPFNFNFKYAAGSAGKLFDFLKHGVPLIAYTTPGMKNLIKGNRIGKCFNKPTKINRALLNISAEYSSLRINCFNSWLKYEFNNQYNTIFENITKK